MIKPYNGEIPQKGSVKSGAYDDIRKFMASSDKVGEIDNSKYKTPHNAQVVYRAAAKRLGAKVKVMTRGGRVLVIKEDE